MATALSIQVPQLSSLRSITRSSAQVLHHKILSSLDSKCTCPKKRSEMHTPLRCQEEKRPIPRVCWAVLLHRPPEEGAQNSYLSESLGSRLNSARALDIELAHAAFMTASLSTRSFNREISRILREGAGSDDSAYMRPPSQMRSRASVG